MSVDTAPLLNELVEVIFTTKRIVKEKYARKHRLDPLSFFRMRCLYYIRDHGRPTMREVANFLDVTPPSATSVINHLVAGGQVRRVLNAKDRRVVRLCLTQKGQACLDQNMEKMKTGLRQMLSFLDKTDQAQLLRVMHKLSTQLRRDGDLLVETGGV